MQKQRYIVHIDMDAFFAAIEQRDNPQLQGKPVIVGADPKKGRGVVSTCSYEARKFGIHSAMPISFAYKNCPKAVFLPVNLEKYSRVSDEIYKIFSEFTPKVEPVSIDEAFLDITASFHLFGAPSETAKLIKSKIKERTKLTASLGLAPTKMAAKISSELGKPDGLIEVSQQNLLDFLWPLSVDKIWGLGEKAKAVLNRMGIRTIGDLAKQNVEKLSTIFGKNGIDFWKLANGIDEREVACDRETKSISNEFTFEVDTADEEKIKGALLELCEKVSGRLRQQNLKARTITLKIRTKDFCTYTKAVTLSVSTNFVDVIYAQIKKLYNPPPKAARLYNGFERKKEKIRLVGVKTSNFAQNDFPESLFADKREEKYERIHCALDRIKEKFGDNSIKRAGARR